MNESEKITIDSRMESLRLNRRRLSNFPYNLMRGENMALIMAEELLQSTPPESDSYPAILSANNKLRQVSDAIKQTSAAISPNEILEYIQGIDQASLNPDRADVEQLLRTEQKITDIYLSLKKLGFSDDELGVAETPVSQ